ncbi:hypothetical protein [Aquimarina brevivitae]|uniref:Outer membrane protein with beta-barrel domain n=1 Tax=Aquimarina brevivitae TaxID=323412 RepID=A0A4Q7P421_9FLAO|nr:hypothetical protein [Aquimarina brevivitae]RZS93442.1 hypothetical protein EV197_2020 [Aquimarina brevivitae]
MKYTNFILLFALVGFTSLTKAQENIPTVPKENFFKFGVQLGIGLGFENIDVFPYTETDQDGNVTGSGDASISAGGGWHINISGDYIIQKKYSIGANFGYHSSFLRPELEDASVRFNRLSFQPTFKYMIGLDKYKYQTLNFGTGYGFYFSPKLKLDIDDAGKASSNYKGSSGFHFLAEYEFFGDKTVGCIVGLKYYNVSFESKEEIGVQEFDDFNGNGIDLYVTITLR